MFSKFSALKNVVLALEELLGHHFLLYLAYITNSNAGGNWNKLEGYTPTPTATQLKPTGNKRIHLS